MASKPPIDLQSALAAAKLKLSEPAPSPKSQRVSRAMHTDLETLKTKKSARANGDGALTLETLAKAWVKTKNFPKA